MSTDRPSQIDAAARSRRAGAPAVSCQARGGHRVTGTVVAATTVAALIAAAFGGGSALGFSRAAQDDAVAAVMAAMALEMIAVPAEPSVHRAASPIAGGAPAVLSVPCGRPAAIAPALIPGPHRLDLPPPALG